MEKELYIKQLRDGIYLMDEAHESTGYLVVGYEKACVIDTMNGYNDLRAAVRSITDKPLVVVNTHGHPDHIMGNVYFDAEVESIMIHPADSELALNFYGSIEDMAKICSETGHSIPPFSDVKEGDIIDLGGRTLEVFELPGHTAGSIVLLLREDRILFSGDAVNHHLWLQTDDALPMIEALAGFDNVMFLEACADVILHGHAQDYDDISLLRCQRNGVADLCDGMTQNDQPYEWFGGTDKMHFFQCLPRKHYQQDDHVICYKEANLPHW